ncbi:DUF1344 domain-containing protein [Phyllobacterium sp. 22229]|uniref:DUF1344 domain-containing protein n=1 Tax=Phyllobacterium myrsinacearum TaxID=28101 RepID=A0A2S9J9S6_9HYPH|nr:DUF1344 domain-containing protein [Phyllobacterium myrsinacearum]PRD49541.1 hypothetical protein C5750_26020 [Phyllobacterium myrsinacearum]PWV83459.1 uncharacterized protein DUF1344 [Phyllobacterium myrsinacearum]RZU96805.1 uncharacterized protein DUF1344 [Phyllobacterium myrsinacearum]
MKRLFLTIATVAALLSGAASAATLSSEIKSIDTKLQTLTLTDGKVYQLARGVSVNKLKIGDKVSVSYDQSGTKLVVTKIEKIK